MCGEGVGTVQWLGKIGVGGGTGGNVKHGCLPRSTHAWSSTVRFASPEMNPSLYPSFDGAGYTTLWWEGKK